MTSENLSLDYLPGDDDMQKKKKKILKRMNWLKIHYFPSNQKLFFRK